MSDFWEDPEFFSIKEHVLDYKLVNDPDFARLFICYHQADGKRILYKTNLRAANAVQASLNDEVARLRARLEAAEQTLAVAGLLGNLVLVDWITG